MEMEQLQQSLAQMAGQLAAPSPTSNSGHSNVYIRGLPLEASEALLVSMFQQFGTVQSVRIFRSSQNPSKAPFAFVKLESTEEAEAAIVQLDGFNLGGCALEVRLADKDAGAGTSDRRPPPSDNIYCKNLPSGFGDGELRQLFAPFGSVTMCRVLHQGDATGQGGAALVRLASMDDATRAVQALQGHRVLGALHPLIIRFADSAEIKAKKQAKQLGMKQLGLSMVPGLVRPTDSATGAAGLMRYSPYASLSGAATGASTAPFTTLPLASPFTTPQPLGGASMSPYYGSTGMAALGTAPLGLSMPAAQTDPVLYMPTDYPLAGRTSAQLMGTNIVLPGAISVASLYVKNLPPYADKLFLYEKFAPFGAILSVKILVNEDGTSRGVGFVNFSETVCAAKAVAALHNLPVGDRNLHVTFQTHHKA